MSREILNDEEMADKVVALLSDHMNSICFNPRAFGALLAQRLDREHRTLQQCIVGALLTAVMKIGEKDKPYCHDLRNEDAVKACRVAREALIERANADADGVWFRFI